MPQRPPGTRGLSHFFIPSIVQDVLHRIASSGLHDCAIRSDRLVLFALNPPIMQIRCQTDPCGKTLVVSRAEPLGLCILTFCGRTAGIRPPDLATLQNPLARPHRPSTPMFVNRVPWPISAHSSHSQVIQPELRDVPR